MQFPPLPDWFWYPITFLYGAIVGSFLNVVIYRVPLGLNIWREKSHCPNCNTFLKPWDNIPILGFLLAGGRCRYCRVPISWRYISVELLTACLWVALYHRISDTASISWINFVFQALFASVLVSLIFIDLDHFFAPDELNVVGFLLALGRDVVCLLMAWKAGGYIWDEWWPRFAYFKFLPRAIPGALAYGALLFVVSVVGFLHYSRMPGEGILAGLRRYRAYLSDEEEAEAIDPTAEIETPGLAVVGVPSAPTPAVGDDGVDDAEEDADDEDPPRLRFSPGILAVVSAALLAVVIGAWGFLALLLPALSFVALARRPNEPIGTTLRRFFQPDEDDDYARDDPTLKQAAAEADEFAREAETGAHGGMGLGDVKLALAIGALLGPLLAMVSLFVATLVGATVGIGIAIRHGRRDLKYGVPFVPFMAIGAIVTMLYGQAFIDWYTTLISPPEARLPAQTPAFPSRRVKPASPRPAPPASTQR